VRMATSLGQYTLAIGANVPERSITSSSDVVLRKSKPHNDAWPDPRLPVNAGSENVVLGLTSSFPGHSSVEFGNSDEVIGGEVAAELLAIPTTAKNFHGPPGYVEAKEMIDDDASE
jgi:hypothetical protein